jgi:hypothetical protein
MLMKLTVRYFVCYCYNKNIISLVTKSTIDFGGKIRINNFMRFDSIFSSIEFQTKAIDPYEQVKQSLILLLYINQNMFRKQ